MKVFTLHFNPVSDPRRVRQEYEQFAIKPPKIEPSVFDTFCFFPKTASQNKKGELFLLLELQNSQKKEKSFLARIAEIIQKAFYSPIQDQIHGQNQTEAAITEQSLKTALAKANNILIQTTSISADSFNGIAVAVSRQNQIYLSQANKLDSLLLTGYEAFSIAQNNIGLADSSDFPDGSSAPANLFSSIIEGKVEQNDKLFIATRQVFEAFLQYKIIQKVMEFNSPKQAKEFFKPNKSALENLTGASMTLFAQKPKIKIFLPQRIFPQSPAPASLRSKIIKSIILLLALAAILLLGIWLF